MKLRSFHIRRGLGLALAVVLLGRGLAAEAASPIEGSWRWSFTNVYGNVIRPILRVTTTDAGTLTGISRFRAGTATPVTNLSFIGDQVRFEVVRIRNDETNVTRYRGALQGDQIVGSIAIGATGEEPSYVWNAFRFSDIEGAWQWRSTNTPAGRGGAGAPRHGAGAGALVTLNLKREEGDKLSGKIKLGRASQDVLQALYENEILTFQTSRERSDGSKSTNYYWGKFSRETITGKFTTDSGGVRRTNTWTAVRAD